MRPHISPDEAHRIAQSHSSACEPQSCAIESTGEREPPEEQGSGSRRARVRCSANLAGWKDCTHNWYHAGESQDRSTKPRLQHPPACDAGADGRCITEQSARVALHGAASAKRKRIRAKSTMKISVPPKRQPNQR